MQSPHTPLHRADPPTGTEGYPVGTSVIKQFIEPQYITLINDINLMDQGFTVTSKKASVTGKNRRHSSIFLEAEECFMHRQKKNCFPWGVGLSSTKKPTWSLLHPYRASSCCSLSSIQLGARDACLFSNSSRTVVDRILQRYVVKLFLHVSQCFMLICFTHILLFLPLVYFTFTFFLLLQCTSYVCTSYSDLHYSFVIFLSRLRNSFF